jgi:hypothetical protein
MQKYLGVRRENNGNSTCPDKKKKHGIKIYNRAEKK